MAMAREWAPLDPHWRRRLAPTLVRGVCEALFALLQVNWPGPKLKGLLKFWPEKYPLALRANPATVPGVKLVRLVRLVRLV